MERCYPVKPSIPPMPPTKKKPLQVKRGRAQAFARANILLFCGQPAFEVDTFRLKIGDGIHRWNRLPYIGEENGKSAYEIWLDEGHTGSVEDFLNSLVGADGKSTYELWLSLGNEGTIADFLKTLEGLSAYEVWIADGHTGTIEDFYEFLRGPQGVQGKSAYEFWRDDYMHDPTLTEDQYIAYITTTTWAPIVENAANS